MAEEWRRRRTLRSPVQKSFRACCRSRRRPCKRANPMRLTWSLILFAGWAFVGPGVGRGEVKFEKDVLPIFTQYCFGCHGKTSPQLGLDLRTAASTLRGSQNGPVIAKGSPEKSLLYQKISTKAMPPPAYNQKLPDAQIEIIRSWIA